MKPGGPFPVVLAALVLLSLVVPVADAWVVMCSGRGPGYSVCFVYRVVVEVKEDYLSIQVWDGDQLMFALCVKPPEVWIGNCVAPPGLRVLP